MALVIVRKMVDLVFFIVCFFDCSFGLLVFVRLKTAIIENEFSGFDIFFSSSLAHLIHELGITKITTKYIHPSFLGKSERSIHPRVVYYYYRAPVFTEQIVL
jgi:hypothetical protein